MDDVLLDQDELLAEVASLDVGADATGDERLLLQYVRRRAQLEAEIARVREAASRLVKELEGKLHGLDYLLGGKAQEVARSLLRGKQRSVKTLWGTVGFRKQGARLEVADERAVLAAVAAGQLPPEAVRTTVAVAKGQLQEWFQATGEVPPGCEVQPERESFYVK